MKKLVLALAFFATAFWAGSQTIVAQPVTSKQSFWKDPVQRMGLSVGTNGLSVDATHGIAKNQLLNLSLGYRFYQFDFQQDWSKKDVTTSPDVNTMILGASYDWFPFATDAGKRPFVKALKVKGGIQYVFNPTYTFDSHLAEDVKWGQMTFTQEEVGTMHTTVTTNKLQPFAAAGYDQFFSAKKWSFGADLGWVYQGKPDVTMKATNMLEPSADQASKVQDNLATWQFFPFVHFRVNYKF